MIYNSISYERTRRKGEDIMTAKVDISIEENDEPHNVMELAQAFIDSQLGVKADAMERKLERLNQQHCSIEREISTLERNLKDAKERWEKAKDFLAKHNVSLDDDIPF